jgi:hypothetical protein
MDLASMTPAGELASSGYCLARPGKEYFVYLPPAETADPSHPGAVEVDLSAGAGPFTTHWFHPWTGQTVIGPRAAGGGRQTFRPPFAGDAILQLRRD